jgi:type II secretion system protein H
MRERQGFTLIELVMVMGIIAIMATVAFVSIRSQTAQNLRAAAERMAGDLRYTRNLALVAAGWRGVSFSVSPVNTYQVYSTDGSTDTVLADLVDSSKDFAPDVADDYTGITISQVNIGGGSRVEFSPLGVPWTDKNGSALGSAGTITLAGGGATLSVSIAPGSGKVTVQ